MRTLQKFAAMHASVHNHFSLDRQFSSRSTFKAKRDNAFQEWRALIAARGFVHSGTTEAVEV